MGIMITEAEHEELKAWRELGREIQTPEGCTLVEKAVPQRAREAWVNATHLVFSKRQELSAWRNMALGVLGVADPTPDKLVNEHARQVRLNDVSVRTIASQRVILNEAASEAAAWRDAAAKVTNRPGCTTHELTSLVDALHNQLTTARGQCDAWAKAARVLSNEAYDLTMAPQPAMLAAWVGRMRNTIKEWDLMSLEITGQLDLGPDDIRRRFKASVKFGAEQKERADALEGDAKKWREQAAHIERVCMKLNQVIVMDSEPVKGLVHPYASLADALQGAFDQAAKGKGKERHADGLPFERQPLVTELRVLGSIEAAVYQVRKKAREAARLNNQGRRDMAVAELRGAIVYAAAGIVAMDLLEPGAADKFTQFAEVASDDQKTPIQLSAPFHPGCEVEVMTGPNEGLRFRVETVTIHGDRDTPMSCRLTFRDGTSADGSVCRLVRK